MKSEKLPQVMSLESASVGIEGCKFENEKKKILGVWCQKLVSSCYPSLLEHIVFVDADMETIVGSSPRVVGFSSESRLGNCLFPFTARCESQQVPDLLLFFSLNPCCLTEKMIQQHRENML